MVSILNMNREHIKKEPASSMMLMMSKIIHSHILHVTGLEPTTTRLEISHLTIKYFFRRTIQSENNNSDSRKI